MEVKKAGTFWINSLTKSETDLQVHLKIIAYKKEDGNNGLRMKLNEDFKTQARYTDNKLEEQYG